MSVNDTLVKMAEFGQVSLQSNGDEWSFSISTPGEVFHLTGIGKTPYDAIADYHSKQVQQQENIRLGIQILQTLAERLEDDL